MNSLNVLPNRPLKPPVDPSTLAYRDLLEDEFWRKIPAYRDIDKETFLDHRWQSKKTINRVDKLLAAIEEFASPGLVADMEAGFKPGANVRTRQPVPAQPDQLGRSRSRPTSDPVLTDG